MAPTIATRALPILVIATDKPKSSFVAATSDAVKRAVCDHAPVKLALA
jgi:hypothetical protein